MKKTLVILIAVGAVLLLGLWLKQVVGDNAPAAHREVGSTATLSTDSLVIRLPVGEQTAPQKVTPLEPDGKTSNWYYSTPFKVPRELKITGFSVEVEGADDSVIHHVSVMNSSRLPTLCPFHFVNTNFAYELFTASRNTLDPVQLPADYGLFVAAGEEIEVQFMQQARAVPYGAHQADELIEPTLVVTMQLDDSVSKPAEFVRLRLDDSPCLDPVAHQAFAVPVQSEPLIRHSTSTPGGSERFTFPAAGGIIYIGANFWPMKGGEKVTSYIDDQPLWEFHPEAGDKDWQWNIPHQSGFVPFAAGDEISLSAQYTNPFKSPVLDASGMLGLYYALDAAEQ